MDAPPQERIFIRLYTDDRLLPVATAFVEKGAAAMGLGQRECLSLALATEEIFACLCRQGRQGNEADITLVNGGYYVRVDFDLAGPAFELQAFNLTACVLPEDDASLPDLGLLIASRSADRFFVSEEAGKRFRLSLVKEKAYPLADDEPPAAPPAEGPYAIRTPDPQELKLFVRAVRHVYPQRDIPPEFKFPGKVVDMVAGGDCRTAVAMDAAGRIGGGIVWRRLGAKTVECLGPYIIAPQPSEQLAVDLLESCINAIARIPWVLGLISRLAPRTLPSAHFEYLGSVTVRTESGTAVELPAYFRQMHEDTGTFSWSHPDLTPFLEANYRRLALPREIRLVSPGGENRHRFSVLQTEIDRPLREAVLRPVLPGLDQATNLRNHLDLFRREGLASIFGVLDLAHPHEAEFIPDLLALGFQPRMIVPHAGDGDQVLFQFNGGLP